MKGTDKDRGKIHAVFKRFGFTPFLFESTPTTTRLVSFAYAASQVKYPSTCKHRVLYIAGHGGFATIDGSGNDPQPFFKVDDERIFIQRDILEVFKNSMKKPRDSFTLFFDCCLNNKEDLQVESYSIGVPPPRCFVAYGTSPGMVATGYKEGGLYTTLVCENLEKLEVGESLSKAMDLTHKAMEEEMKNRAEKQSSKLKADCAHHDDDTCKEKAEDDDAEDDTIITQLPLVISSAGPIYFNGILTKS